MMNRSENVHPDATASLQASVAHFVMYRESDNISLGSSLLVTITRDVKRRFYSLTAKSC
jgi:hypothetical protein